MVSKEYIEEQKEMKGNEFCVCPKCGHKVPKNETTPCPKYKCTKCGQQMVEKEKGCNPCQSKKRKGITSENYNILENGDEDESEDEEGEETKTKPLSQKQKKDLQPKIIEFFKKNPSPPDDDVHDFAESIGMKPDELESHIYKILGSFLGAGKSKDYKGEYDQKELEMGIKVEMEEHTSNPILAEKIAKDHLVEIPGTGNNDGYYSKLKKMEADAEH